MYIPEHDGELQGALRVIAETRKNLEQAGDMAGLQSLYHLLATQRYVILGSMVNASDNRWRDLVENDDVREAEAIHHMVSMSPRAFDRVWSVVEQIRKETL